MKKQLLFLTLIISLCLFASVANAQPGFEDDVEDTPLDGGISLLVGAGVLYGAKKVAEMKKKN
jgi:hypothetical protein